MKLKENILQSYYRRPAPSKARDAGFTIIEVLIVLAIAGLILLIVFLAVPALQRNSRNTQRKEDASKAVGVFQESVNNNNGNAVTGTTAPSILSVANANYAYDSAVDYNVSAGSFQALPATLADGTLYFRNFSTCGSGGNGQLGVTGGVARNFTITYIVESPGTAAANGVPAGYTAQCIKG
jgi:prepilin-type N-terminal cleavage/methylation domain-containing protein